MTEPTIICPNCRTEIKLTESLAAPLIASTRQQFEAQLAKKDSDIAQRETAMREKEKALTDAKRDLDEQVADEVASQLKTERTRVVAEEAKKAKAAAANELDAKARELVELQDVMKVQDVKAKAEAGALWCRHVSDHARKIGAKPWKYLLIPHDLVTEDKRLVDYLSFEAVVK